MRRQVTAVLFLVSLSGCSRGDPQLQLDLSDIKSLCEAVAYKAFSEMNARDSNRPSALAQDFNWIKNGAVAECELEYRIKQQEAHKPF